MLKNVAMSLLLAVLIVAASLAFLLGHRFFTLGFVSLAIIVIAREMGSLKSVA